MSKSTCCIHECGRPVFGHLLCQMHYGRMRSRGTTNQHVPVKRKCKMPSCTRGVKSTGLCDVHYNKYIRPKVNPQCAIVDCGQTVVANLLCSTHYGRLRDTGSTLERVRVKPKCRMPSCSKSSRKLGWCDMHHSRITRTGSPFDKDQKWVLGERGPCVECGEPTVLGSGLRRYCSRACALEQYGPDRSQAKDCMICGEAIDLNQRHESGRRKYSSATRCTTCRTPRLTHLVPALVDRDGSDCHLCKAAVDLSLAYPDPMSRSVDHVIPRSKGGPDAMENYGLSHLTCNVRKNNRIDWVPA